jgi:hypothetical protein
MANPSARRLAIEKAVTDMVNAEIPSETTAISRSPADRKERPW